MDLLSAYRELPPRKAITKATAPVTKGLISMLLFACSAFGEDATVTFYSVGSLGKAILQAEVTLGVRSHPPFVGFLFDGEHRLGLMQANRFVTLHVSEGNHTFAAGSWSSPKRPSTKFTLPLNAESGKRYFIQLRQTNKGFWAIQLPYQEMELVDCDTARTEASKAKPLAVKRVDKDVRGSIGSAAAFPGCQ